jgi:predicted GNAT family acetyltransferase
MASIWDLLDAIPRREDVSPEELAARRQGYADLYAGGFLSRNKDEDPMSVRAMQASQDFIPGIGDAIAFGEAGQALSEGDRRAAALLAAGGLLGVVPGAGDALARPVIAAGRKVASAIPSEAIYAGRSLAEGDMRGVLDAFTPGRPAQGLGADAVKPFDIRRSDASQIFGEGSERVRYTDPTSGGAMEVVVRPDGSASVLELEVPEASRGRGVGQSLQAQVLQDYPKMGGQVSSKAAAKTAYRLGRRPYGQPDATLDDVFAIMDDMSSVNLISPAAQPQMLPPARTPAQEQARNILEMRAAGRASEVTDEMMAAADPEYMYSNTPLPMDEASRMARAQGVRALHGTGADIGAVDPAYFGNGQDLLGTGFYTTASNPRAERYVPSEMVDGKKVFAEGGNVMPLMVREPRPFMLDEPLGGAADEIASIYKQDPFFDVDEMSSGAKVVRDGDGKGVMLDPYQQRHWALQNMRKSYGPSYTSDVLSEAGYSGVSGPESAGGRVRLSYDPTDIRSIFARFDPEFAHLRNLSAGVGGAGLLSMGYPQDEQY